jgi:SAM-dependent methyltransferase
MSRRANDARRIANEISHHRRIAPKAESIWNWDSPSGRRRATRRAGFYIEVLDVTKRLRALELGCGSGVFLKRTTAASRARIIAPGLSIDLITKARGKLEKADQAVFAAPTPSNNRFQTAFSI